MDIELFVSLAKILMDLIYTYIKTLELVTKYVIAQVSGALICAFIDVKVNIVGEAV